MDLLGLDLRNNVHGDLIKLVLQVFDFLSELFDVVHAGLLVKVLVLLRYHEVDLFGFAVELAPAHLHVQLAHRLNRELALVASVRPRHLGVPLVYLSKK